MNTITAFLIGIIATVGGWFNQEQPKTLAGFGDPFLSVQLATSPANGECLTTDGTNNDWGSCGTGSGGSGNVSTSTGETAGYLSYWTSTNATPALLGKVATTTASCSGDASCTPFTVIGTVPVDITATAGAGAVDGTGVANALTSWVDSNTVTATGTTHALYVPAINATTTATSTFSGALRVRVGAEGDPSIAFGTEANTGFHLQSAGVIDVNVPSQFRVDVNNSSAIYDFQSTQFLPAPNATNKLGAFGYAWNGLVASGTSYIDYASTTQISIGTDYITDLSTGLSISALGAVTVTDVTCTNCLTNTEVASADLATLATNVSDTDFGDLTVSGGAWSVEDDSHAHTATTISGLGVSDFSSANISQWTNDAGYTTFAYPFPSAATSTRLTFSGGLDFPYSSSTVYSSFLTSSSTFANIGTLTFGGVTGSAWSTFCTSITGSADLCDGADATGGGSGGGSWSTTTSSVAGQNINYPNETDDIVAIGSNSTTTAEFYFDPNTGLAAFGNGGAGDSTLSFGPNSNEWIMGYDATDKSFAIASSTALGTLNKLTISKAGVLTSGYSSSTIYSSFLTASSTNWYGGGLQTCDATTGKLTWSGGQFGCGTDFNTGAGGGSDPFTHPAVGQSATTSLMLLYGQASSTLLSANWLKVGGVASTTLDEDGVATIEGGLILKSAASFEFKNADDTATLTMGNGGATGENLLEISASGGTDLSINNSGLVSMSYSSSTAYSSFATASTSNIIVSNSFKLFSEVWNSLTDVAEYIADTAGAMFTGNTETGITVTYQDADNTVDVVCDTASGSVFGCLSTTDWTTFNNKQATITDGDGLTFAGATLNFDGGTAPGGSLGGTWASPTIDDLFLLNNGDAGTGVYDFGGATSFEIPNGTSPTVGAIGIIALDTTSNNLILATSTSGHIVIASATSTLFSVMGTTTGITSGLTVEAAPFDKQTVITDIGCKVSAATSLQVTLSDSSNSTNTITCSTTWTNFAITANNTWTANERLQVVYGTKTGDPGDLVLRVNGYQIAP